MRIGWIAMGTALIACTAASCRPTPPPPSNQTLTPQDLFAVAVAETFVRQHGYTDQFADPVAIAEDDEYRALRPFFSTDIARLRFLQLRSGSLVAQAYGFSRDRDGGTWGVIFEFTPKELKWLNGMSSTRYDGSGSLVIVSPDFRPLGVAHMDFSLAAVEVVLRPPLKSK
jgi:hypothetical protein